MSGSERFQFGQGFGAATIDGFLNSGGNADTIQLSISAFSYLNAGMTQAQDLAAVIARQALVAKDDFDRFAGNPMGLPANPIARAHFPWNWRIVY